MGEIPCQQLFYQLVQDMQHTMKRPKAMLHKVREREGQGMWPSPMRSEPTPHSDLSNLAIHDTQVGDETKVALENAAPAVEQTGAFPDYQCDTRRQAVRSALDKYGAVEVRTTTNCDTMGLKKNDLFGHHVNVLDAMLGKMDLIVPGPDVQILTRSSTRRPSPFSFVGLTR